VYINSAQITSTADRQGIISAASAWSGLNGVTVATVVLGGPPAPTGNYVELQVNTYQKNGAITNWGASQTGYMNNAVTTIDPSNLARAPNGSRC
jgi:hypothetical protein